MNRPSAAGAAFLLLVTFGAGAASAETILYSFAGLRGGASDTCKWFDDNITDRSLGALTRQTDLLFNRVALPPGVPVTVGGTAVTAANEQLIDFKLNSATICTAAETVYGPTPSPAPSS